MEIKLRPIFIALAIDPIQHEVFVTGFAMSQDAAMQSLKNLANEDALGRVFNIISSTFAADLYAWLRECKIVDSEARKVMYSLGHEMGKVLLNRHYELQPPD